MKEHNCTTPIFLLSYQQPFPSKSGLGDEDTPTKPCRGQVMASEGGIGGLFKYVIDEVTIGAYSVHRVSL